jgi:hypothetical protein
MDLVKLIASATLALCFAMFLDAPHLSFAVQSVPVRNLTAGSNHDETPDNMLEPTSSFQLNKTKQGRDWRRVLQTNNRLSGN